MQTYTPVRGMTVCSEGGEYCLVADAIKLKEAAVLMERLKWQLADKEAQTADTQGEVDHEPIEQTSLVETFVQVLIRQINSTTCLADLFETYDLDIEKDYESIKEWFLKRGVKI